VLGCISSGRDALQVFTHHSKPDPVTAIAATRRDPLWWARGRWQWC